MPRPITVSSHLTVEQLYERFRSSKKAMERAHWQTVWMAASGKPSKAIVEATTYNRAWVFVVIKRYNDEGPDGLLDRRRKNGGHNLLLIPSQQEELAEALLQEPPGGGLWNSLKVADWIAQKTGRKVSKQRGWDYLRRLGFSTQRPRARHAKANAKQQEAFKRGVWRKQSKS
jgi:transposase